MARKKETAGGSESRVVYQLVAPMEKSLGPEEIERRRAFLKSYAAPGTIVDVRSIKRGAAAIESAYDAAMAVPYILESLREPPCGPGIAVIIGCFSDPGLDAVARDYSRSGCGAGDERAPSRLAAREPFFHHRAKRERLGPPMFGCWASSPDMPRRAAWAFPSLSSRKGTHRRSTASWRSDADACRRMAPTFLFSAA